MSNSLNSKLSKLRHDGHITNKEYQILKSKLNETDTVVRNKTIDEFCATAKAIVNGNEPMYEHDDGTWHNLLDDTAKVLKERT